MINLEVQNIKGLHSPLKQKEIRYLMRKNNLVILSILETKVKEISRRPLLKPLSVIDSLCLIMSIGLEEGYGLDGMMRKLTLGS